jgi:3-deoxy-D-manno-octulosonic-acid transferase
LQRSYPERHVYLSHVTPAGREAGEKRLPTITGRFYVPLDWRWTARKALARIKPSLLLVAETELWPNILRTARQAGARVVVVNARMSAHSFRGYQFVRPFLRRVLADVDQICAQTEEDAERFRRLGAPATAVRLVGNLKFDAQPPQAGEFAHALKTAVRAAGRGPVFVAASTMPGEEPLVLEAWDLIRVRYPQALLILAPRHPARFDSVSEDLARQQRAFVRRTTARPQELASQLSGAAILLLDTVGELAGIFELADMVFMGGSLVPTGGHNLLEPAYWSKVIAFGPHMENFRDIARLFLEANAALQVRSPQELAQASALLENVLERERLGARARWVLEQHSGATARTLDCLRPYLLGEEPDRKSIPGEVQ